MYELIEYREPPEFPHTRVGSDGSVWSCRRGRGLAKGGWYQRKTTEDAYGHLKLFIETASGTRVHRYIHRLVLEVFVSPCPPGMQARHLDDNPKNNRLTNLRWGTPAENAADAKRNGRQPIGERHGGAKLTESDVRRIRQRLRRGESRVIIAREYGLHYVAISDIDRGLTWRHLTCSAA